MSEKTELSAREVEEAVRAAYTRPDEAATQRESVEEKCAYRFLMEHAQN